MNMTTMKNSNRKSGRPELRQMIDIEEIRFNRIYVNAIPLENGMKIYGYVRDWKNGEVGYSVLEEATDNPDFSNSGMFWMAPEDFAKVFVVYRDMAVDYSHGKEPDNSRNNMESMSEFREKVKNAVMDAVPDDKKVGMTLSNTDIVKINDQKLYGLAFHSMGAMQCPTFYLNESYEHYIHGMPLEPIVKQLVNSYLFSVTGMNQEIETKFNIDFDSGFDDIKDRLAFKVLEIERNQEYLKHYPYKEIGYGFAVVFDVQTVIGGHDEWRMPVTSDILDKVGISVDELYDAAMENVNEVDPAVLMSLDRKESGAKMKNMLEDNKHINKSKRMMYLLTNRCGRFGAAALFYPGMQKRIAEKLEDSYYAIPSSLHEFIIVPESAGADIRRLHEKLICDNYSSVNQEDVFSDSIFLYDREQRDLVCVNELIDSKAEQLRNELAGHDGMIS